MTHTFVDEIVPHCVRGYTKIWKVKNAGLMDSS
jgi:hypothetical protein